MCSIGIFGWFLLGVRFRFQDCRLKVEGSGLRGPRLWFGVEGLGLRVEGVGLRVEGSGFRVWGSGLGVWGSGFRREILGKLIDRQALAVGILCENHFDLKTIFKAILATLERISNYSL